MPNHSNQQQTESSSSDINFSASHDQAALTHQMSKGLIELEKIPDTLNEFERSLQQICPEGLILAQQQRLLTKIAEEQKNRIEEVKSTQKKGEDLLKYLLSQIEEEQKNTIEQVKSAQKIYENLHMNQIEEEQKNTLKQVQYARAIVEDLQIIATKLNPIYLKSPQEKLKAARSLLNDEKPLNKKEENRFLKLEPALGNTCIIKSAGNETIKFQLGVLANATEGKLLTESEYNHLAILRLQNNNLIDEFRVIEGDGDMILEETPLAIGLAIDRSLFDDDDYQDSKSLFIKRLKGIDYQYSLEKLNEDKRKKGFEKRDSLWNELKAANERALTTEIGSEGEALNLAEVETTDPEREENLERINQDLKYKMYCEKLKEMNSPLTQNKSKFVEIMEQFIPKDHHKKFIIDDITPTPLEDIMRVTLERKSPVSNREALRINFACNRAELKNRSIADEKYMKILEDPSSLNSGDDIHQETLRESKKILGERDEKRKETKPCKLSGKDLANQYREETTGWLKSTRTDIKAKLSELDHKFNKHFDEFSRLQLEQKHGKLYHDGKKQIREEMFREEKGKLNRQLDKTDKHLALWQGKDAFIKNVYNEKQQIIKKERITFSEKELESRDLVLKDDPHHETQHQNLGVVQACVCLLPGKNKPLSTLFKKEKTDDRLDKPAEKRLSSNRALYKEKLNSPSSLFSTSSASNSLTIQPQEKIKAKKYALKSS